MSQIHLIQASKDKCTIAYTVIEEDDLLKVTYAVATAAPRDNFSRKLGRKIAEARLGSSKRGRKINIVFPEIMPKTGVEWSAFENMIMTIALQNLWKLRTHAKV